jgi:nitrogen regulatory protein P-II 2
MKLVKAVIQAGKLDAVRDALSIVGVSGLTVSEVRGFGRQRGHTGIYRGAEHEVESVPKVLCEIAVETDRVDVVTTAIASAARSGRIGDGKVFVHDLAGALRIRTGETDAAALSTG